MQSNKHLIIYALLISLLGVFCSILGALEITGAAVTTSSIASVLLIALSKRLSGEYTSLLFIFSLFFSLYGLSGPINTVLGIDLHPLFPVPYATDHYLVAYGLSISGFSTGLVIAYKRPLSTCHALSHDSSFKKGPLLHLAIIFSFLSSAMETINWYRVEGWSLIFEGKAAYQSAISELSLTLPSSQTLILAAALLGLGLRRKASRKEWALTILFLVSSLPILSVYLFIGGRGIILKALLAFVLARSFARPIKTIKTQHLVAIVMVYVAMGALFQIRGSLGTTVQEGNYSHLATKAISSEFWVSALNPGANEFGAAFGNFSTYIKSEEWDRKLGTTYLETFTVPIPRFLWEDKPQAVTYRFRDEYFPSEAARGEIAGTAFSSILEAYMNLGLPGVFSVYLAISFALSKIETKKRTSKKIFFALLYSTLSAAAISYHRSAFGNLMFWPIFLAFTGSFSYIAMASLRTALLTNSRNEK